MKILTVDIISIFETFMGLQV